MDAYNTTIYRYWQTNINRYTIKPKNMALELNRDSLPVSLFDIYWLCVLLNEFEIAWKIYWEKK